jgi:hypothetical protein
MNTPFPVDTNNLNVLTNTLAQFQNGLQCVTPPFFTLPDFPILHTNPGRTASIPQVNSSQQHAPSPILKSTSPLNHRTTPSQAARTSSSSPPTPLQRKATTQKIKSSSASSLFQKRPTSPLKPRNSSLIPKVKPGVFSEPKPSRMVKIEAVSDTPPRISDEEPKLVRGTC